MTGFLTSDAIAMGFPFTGREESPLDINPASGNAFPLTVRLALYKQALVLGVLQNSLSKTMVAGTIYYTQIGIGGSYTPTPRGSAINQASFVATGMLIGVGGTGGSDTWHVGIWNSSGVLVARSATAGATAGTALTYQQMAFAGSSGTATGVDAPVTLTSGTYYLGLQSSGTTATFKSLNSPIWPTNTGSQTGTAATLPVISSISTTYTANLGPQLYVY